MNKENKHTDQAFKAAFEKLEVQPPPQNWDKIEEEMDNQLDEHFRNELAPMGLTPKPHVWQKISNKLPLHPGVRRYVSWMTKIAAVLVVGMLLTILFDRQQKELVLNNLQQESRTPTSISPETNFFEESPGEFVFEVEKISSASVHPRKYKRQDEEEIKNLLQFILEDDDDFAEATNQEIIDESLKPATTLNNGFALVFPENDETPTNESDISNDLEIRIPLKIVENEQEAEALIQIYESSHKPVPKSAHVQ